ncbi:MAG: SMC family ATPase, partial [Treponema sp.]|nr:SMC family ATPase [Treponema sp.]
PFVDETVINFDEFGNNGLFLVTGDTGSGKTTIFDAITFALFGSASGSTRNSVSALRSDFADEDNRTFVELEFLNKGEKYTINRKAQHRKQNRKTPISEEISLICPCGTVLSQIDATNKINELIGLDKNQFAQIVMLAQGEFQRLLNSNTKDRREIFQKIFKTYALYTFQQKLKLRADIEKGNFKSLENSILQYVEGINSDNALETLAFEKQSFLNAKNCYSLDTLLELLDQSNNLDNEKLVKLQKDFEEKNKQNEELVKQIETVTTIENNRKTLADIIQKLPQIELELQTKKSNYETEKADEKVRNSVAVQIDKIEKSIPQYSQLSKVENELKIKYDELITAEKSLKYLKEQFEKDQKSYFDNKKSVKAFENLNRDRKQIIIPQYIRIKENDFVRLLQPTQYNNQYEETKRMRKNYSDQFKYFLNNRLPHQLQQSKMDEEPNKVENKGLPPPSIDAAKIAAIKIGSFPNLSNETIVQQQLLSLQQLSRPEKRMEEEKPNSVNKLSNLPSIQFKNDIPISTGKRMEEETPMRKSFPNKEELRMPHLKPVSTITQMSMNLQ